MTFLPDSGELRHEGMVFQISFFQDWKLEDGSLLAVYDLTLLPHVSATRLPLTIRGSSSPKDFYSFLCAPFIAFSIFAI